MLSLSSAEGVYVVLALAGLSLLLGILGLGFGIYANRRLSKLMLGRNNTSLEETLGTLGRRTKELESFRSEVSDYLKRAETRMASSLRGVGVVRFNPFKGDGSGGNQSFSAAFVDEAGSGVVLSTLYSRDRVSMFGKPLEKGSSSFELTEEEQAAVADARKKTS